MVRRGPITFRSVPIEQLFAFIRKKALLGADEISEDGKSWIRIDRHCKLRKFFSNEDHEIKLSESEPDLSVEHENFETTADIENKFQEVVDLLRDMND
tara:strand:- start:20 stop:313 length:294 start_codon:yes stop_codon:yes gene_type:complete